MKARLLRKLLHCEGYIIHHRRGEICIGSPYVPDLISLDLETMKIRYALDTFHQGREAIKAVKLVQIWDRMHDLVASGEIEQVIDGADEIEHPLPVFGIGDDYQIIEDVTDAYGWPNTTANGVLMYDNSWFQQKIEAVERAKKNCAATMAMCDQRIVALNEQIMDAQGWLNEAAAALDTLSAESDGG